MDTLLKLTPEERKRYGRRLRISIMQEPVTDFGLPYHMNEFTLGFDDIVLGIPGARRPRPHPEVALAIAKDLAYTLGRECAIERRARARSSADTYQRRGPLIIYLGDWHDRFCSYVCLPQGITS